MMSLCCLEEMGTISFHELVSFVSYSLLKVVYVKVNIVFI